MTRRGAVAVVDLVEYVEHFQKRVVQDALAEATRDYWLRRAEAFEAALPRPEDFPGRASPEEAQARRSGLGEVVLACRARAEVSLIGGPL